MSNRSAIRHRLGRGSMAAIAGLVGTLGAGAGAGVLTGLSGGAPVAAAASAGPLSDNVFVVDATPQGSVIEVPSGNGTSKTLASGYADPTAVAVDAAGTVFVSDEEAGTVYEQQAGGTKTVFASGLSRPVGMAFNAKGSLFVADSGANEVLEYPAGGGTPAAVGSGLSDPTAIAVNTKGDVYIADTGNGRIVEVAPSGRQTVIASGLTLPEGVAVDAQGDIYISNTRATDALEIPAGSTTPQVLANGLAGPEGLAVTGNGIVLAANSGDTDVVELNPSLLTEAGAGTLPKVGDGFENPTAVAVQAISVPGKPTIGVAPGNGSATISFEPPASDGNGTITSYALSFTDVTTDVTTSLGNAGQGPVTVSGLADGARYDFSVAAVNSAGAGPAATISNVEIGVPATVAGIPQSATLGMPYAFTFALSGTPKPTIAVTGSLPPGLTLSTTASFSGPAGRLSGTPTTAGTYRFTVSATNGVGSVAELKVKLVVAK